jgi:hypothetical protein
MTDIGSILRKLSVLGAERPVFREGLRVLSNGVYPPPLVALLVEVDATVLKRQLQFHAGDSRLGMIVAGRRVLQVTSGSADLAGVASLVGAALSPDDGGACETLAETLQALCGAERVLTVESSVPDATASAASVGISGDVLAEILMVDRATSPVQMFIETCEAHYSACLFWSGGAWIGHADDQALLARLRPIAEAQRQRMQIAYRGADQSGEAPRLIILDKAMADEGSVSAAWANDEFAIFVHPPEDGAAIHAAWRRIFTL